MTAGWLAQLRDCGVLGVGKALGLQEIRRGSLSPCPSCGRETRGSHDRRGPIGVRRDNTGWVCHRCDARGDPITLAAWVLEGTPRPGQWQRIWTECADAGLCDSPSDYNCRTTSTVRRRRRPRSVPTPYVPRYPDAGEVWTLWERCLPVNADQAVASWLAGRQFEPETVASLDLVRALPSDSQKLPPWARMGSQSWAATTHRVTARFWNARGKLVTLHARATDAETNPKGLSPRGFDIQGAVMADRNGWELLSTGKTTRRVIIAEGVPDWLVWSLWAERAGPDKAPAVLGVISGSWTDELATRIPDETRVLIRTHNDKTGHKYADKISASLVNRCTVLRRAVALENKG